MYFFNPNNLTITILPEEGNVSASELIDALNDAVSSLRYIDLNMSPQRMETVRWEIAWASTNSPLTIQLAPVPIKKRPQHGKDVVKAYVDGIKALESSEEAPPYFNDAVLNLKQA